MKTREEMVYEFMVALCGSSSMAFTNEDELYDVHARHIQSFAEDLADQYLSFISGK